MKRNQKHCRDCNAPRKGTSCHKCNGPLNKPHRKWKYPKLPPVKKIQALGKEVGYAIAIHGSRERDLDLVAAPWTENAVSQHTLMTYIANKLGARMYGVEKKPLGRLACNIQMNGWFKIIDLSVCPRGEYDEDEIPAAADSQSTQ